MPGSKSFELLSDVMGKEFSPLGSKVSIPGDITVTLKQLVIRESSTIGDIITFLFSWDGIIKEVALGLAINWLYDKLKKHEATKIHTEGQEAPIEEEEKVERVIRFAVELKTRKTRVVKRDDSPKKPASNGKNMPEKPAGSKQAKQLMPPKAAGTQKKEATSKVQRQGTESSIKKQGK